MNSQKYILAPYKGSSSRLKCPSCGKAHELSPYVDSDTGNVLADHVGRCNRENNCGYHYTPKRFFTENKTINVGEAFYGAKQVKQERPIDFIPFDLVHKSLKLYDSNNFYNFLCGLFTKEITDRVFAQYKVGTSIHWKGATIFWQIDRNDRVRQCKVMLYDAATGKRVRAGSKVKKYNPIRKEYDLIEAHQDCSKVYGKYLTMQTRNLELEQCFFGEHLLRIYPDKAVAIVESEKTAVIASIYFPEYTWLATGGKYGCKWNNFQVYSVLENKSIVMFPDAFIPKKISDQSPYNLWSERAFRISNLIKCDIYVSDILEINGTVEQKLKGWDLVDFLVRRDESVGLAITEEGYPVIWDL